MCERGGYFPVLLSYILSSNNLSYRSAQTAAAGLQTASNNYQRTKHYAADRKGHFVNKREHHDVLLTCHIYLAHLTAKVSQMFSMPCRNPEGLDQRIPLQILIFAFQLNVGSRLCFRASYLGRVGGDDKRGPGIRRRKHRQATLRSRQLLFHLFSREF